MADLRMAQDDGIPEFGPTRLIDDRSLRMLRAKSRTSDGSLPADSRVITAQRASTTPQRKRSRWWLLAAPVLGGVIGWSMMGGTRVPQAAPAPVEAERIVMPVQEPEVPVAEVTTPSPAKVVGKRAATTKSSRPTSAKPAQRRPATRRTSALRSRR